MPNSRLCFGGGNVIAWERLDSAIVPGSKSRIELWRRGDELCIRVDAEVLMNSRLRASEEAHATLPCEMLATSRQAKSRQVQSQQASHAHEPVHVLVGGLGMGWTLAAALASLSSSDQVTVAELVPEVVTWNHGPLSHLAGYPLQDPRVSVHIGDVAALIRSSTRAWDIILLDVDNGPDAFTRPDNDSLYGKSGLHAIHQALRPGGILSVWSAYDAPAFSKQLRACGFLPETHQVRARGKDGRRHTIWTATKTR